MFQGIGHSGIHRLRNGVALFRSCYGEGRHSVGSGDLDVFSHGLSRRFKAASVSVRSWVPHRRVIKLHKRSSTVRKPVSPIPLGHEGLLRRCRLRSERLA